MHMCRNTMCYTHTHAPPLPYNECRWWGDGGAWGAVQPNSLQHAIPSQPPQPLKTSWAAKKTNANQLLTQLDFYHDHIWAAKSNGDFGWVTQIGSFNSLLSIFPEKHLNFWVQAATFIFRVKMKTFKAVEANSSFLPMVLLRLSCDWVSGRSYNWHG